MSDFQALTFEEVATFLASPADTLILFHRNPDADAIGSAFALKKILSDLGSRAWCVCCNEIPDRLRFLADSEQDSVLPQSVPQELSVSRIISVDTASPAQLGELFGLYGDRIDLMIDHHGMGEQYADGFIRPDAAATAEILFDIGKKLAMEEKITLDTLFCMRLYAAISSDTGCFKYSNVTPSTHIAAAGLIKHGIDAAEINRLLFDTKSPARLHAEKVGLDNLSLFMDYRVSVVALDYDEIERLRIDPEEFDAFIDAARLIEGAEVAFSVRRPSPEESFRVSMRSMSDVDVSVICATFGGGGHVKAAGCSIDAATKEEVIEKVLVEIAKQLK